ncbi:hypothetical protein [Aliikangiella coralliicola]|uniref:Uncharacterized protein n=1 Tax=Aliikangiella coralliicola TaxID=2592383 RepID=A0A545UFD6_9GAMM|nr:hypothetical protein [Aliikangiella coralliicola]TQV88103.1 hypothetical protein FLL46_06135 [Aliikangiella coralliicola]
MGYQIEAYLDNGKPSLKIYDLEQNALCLSWTYSGKSSEKRSKQEVHQLFRELLLLTCKQDIHNVRVFNLSPRQLDS